MRGEGKRKPVYVTRILLIYFNSELKSSLSAIVYYLAIHKMLMSSYEGDIKGIRTPLMTQANSELVTTATEEHVLAEEHYANLGK